MTNKNIAQQAYDQMKTIPRNKTGNPLTFEGTVRAMILKNPDMIQWRDDALNMMFCTLGSGMGWDEQGRLGDMAPNNYVNMPPAAGGQGIWADDYGMEDTFSIMKPDKETIARIRKFHDQRMEAAIQTVEDIDNRCTTYKLKRSGWYPISWYSPNLAAPDNAQDDFLKGAIETATLMSTLEFDVFEDRYWVNSMQTKEVAKDILEILKAR